MRILILCTGNSCRSQMAEAILRRLDSSLEVYSAGTAPAQQVHPLALRVLEEIGIRHGDGRPKRVDRFLGQAFDYVITVCDHAKETCPVFTGAVGRRLHFGFDDPASASGTDEEILAEFRRVRDEIRERFETFVRSELKGHRT